jgi:ABC-type multidrug transport system ATPase subunit
VAGERRHGDRRAWRVCVRCVKIDRRRSSKGLYHYLYLLLSREQSPQQLMIYYSYVVACRSLRHPTCVLLGGQKARIALARAMYSDADIYLLDDVLSAVDAHVGKDLFFEAILSCLKTKRNKAIVLVTHQLQHMQHADKVLVLDKNGTQTFFGSYDELQKNGTSLEDLGVDTAVQDATDSAEQGVEHACEDRGGRRSRSSTVGSYAMGEEEGHLFGSAIVDSEAVSLDFVQAEGEEEEEEVPLVVNEEGEEGEGTDDCKLMRNTIIQSEDRNIGHVT